MNYTCRIIRPKDVLYGMYLKYLFQQSAVRKIDSLITHHPTKSLERSLVMGNYKKYF
jgi:hypothetical protein